MNPSKTYENILVETRGPVGLITLNRPKALAQPWSASQAVAGFERRHRRHRAHRL